jgi:HEPN domain-containing protein
MKLNTKWYTHEDASCLELLRYGRDHINASTHLFVTHDLRLYDSAGFLAHLGIELYLKAALLHLTGRFPNSHLLVDLALEINKASSLIGDEIVEKLKWLDSLWNLKYPNLKAPIELGTEDVWCFTELVKILIPVLPDGLMQQLTDSDPTEKGGRLWMERKRKDHNPPEC